MTDPKTHEIYLVKDGYTQRLTDDEYPDAYPVIDANYVVWRKDFVRAEKRYGLMYYDGRDVKQLDEGSIGINGYATFGNKIFWVNYEEIQRGPIIKRVHYNYFDGAKVTKDYFPSHIDSIKLGVHMGKTFFVFSRKERDNSYSLYKYNFNDTIKIYSVTDSFFSYFDIRGESVHFAVNKLNTGFGKNYFYNGGNVSEYYITTKDTLTGFRSDGTIIDSVTHGFFKNFTRIIYTPDLYIWRNGKFYYIATYPFTEIVKHPELQDIETVFTVPRMVNETEGIHKTEVFLFIKDGIYNISQPGQSSTDLVVKGKYAAWIVFTPSRPKDQLTYHNNTAEIYSLCNDDNCKEPWRAGNFQIDAYSRESKDDIAVKIVTDKKSTYQYILHDLAGRRLIEGQLNALYGENIFSLPTNLITQGLYILQVINPGKADEYLVKKLFLPN